MSKSSVDSLQKRHVLFQGPHPRPRDRICKQCAGQINLFFGSSVPTVRKIPSQCQPQQVYTEMQPPSSYLQAGSSLALVGNVGNWLGQISAASHADPANASLWICARKLIGQTPAAGLQQEPSALVPHFCGQEAAGCNVLGECIVRHCCLHPQLPAVAPSASHGELRSRSSPCSTAQARLPCGEM